VKYPVFLDSLVKTTQWAAGGQEAESHSLFWISLWESAWLLCPVPLAHAL